MVGRFYLSGNLVVPRRAVSPPPARGWTAAGRAGQEPRRSAPRPIARLINQSI